MDRSNVSCKKSGDTSSLLQEVQSVIGNIQITEYAYGIYDSRCRATNSSRESIQSAYEASPYESIANSTTTDDSHYYSTGSAGDGMISPPEMFKSIISSPSRVESPSTLNSASSASSTSDNDLPDILHSVKENIANLSRSLENAQYNAKLELAPLESSQSTPIKSNAGSINISYPKPLTDQDVAIRSPSKKKMLEAQSVHGMVVEKYGDTYKRLLQKLKKLNLTAEENRSRKVIAQLETMFEKNSNSSGILRNVASAKMCSSDSEGSHVGIPQSGDHHDDIKEASYKKFVAQAPLDKMIAPEVVQVFTCTTEVHQEACNGSYSAEYDEHQFIQTAIGEELLRDASSNEYLFSPTASLDTDDVSALHWSKSTLVPLLKRRKRYKIGRSLIKLLTNSDYEPATESRQTYSTPDLINEPFRYSYASYEDVTNLGVEIYSDEGKMLIKKHIYINDTIIEQTEKMLKYGLRKQSHFIGSYTHLEGERILLVSMKYLREVTPYFRKASIISEVGWELQRGFLSGAPPVVKFPQRADTRYLPLQLCHLARNFRYPDPEGRTLELHSPDAVHSCVLRAADPAEAVAWFNTLHSALSVLTTAALHEASRAIPDLRHIGWLLRKPKMENNMSSSESSEDMERWQSVFAAVTDSELRFYESAPWSGEAWRAPAEAYSLIATRLVGSGKRDDFPEFSIRCATVDGVMTHSLRAETHRDLAVWAKSLVNGSHASAVTQKELVCRCLWKGRPAQLVIHYENGFTLLEAGTGSRTLWRYSFDRLRNSSDDGKRYLWLDFGNSEEGEVELDIEGCPKPIVFILHNFLSAKIHRLGLTA